MRRVFVGGAGGMGVTLILNVGSETVALPSLTLITIFAELPTLAIVGVPLSRPLPASNPAHAGLPEIEKVSVYLCGPLAVGVKL